jgi:2-amino-4-hydroxy-6-hydroxymethyldihydropteridine diphosphokinase
MHTVYLSLGGNMGDKAANFTKAYACIKQTLGNLTTRSSVYDTPPWGFHAENNFWNQVVILETELTPEALLEEIHAIEALFGRKRNSGGYLSRAMDIDILYYDDLTLHTRDLIIPHPLIPQRKFVLTPLAEIAPELKHPILQITSLQMLRNSGDSSTLQKRHNEVEP